VLANDDLGDSATITTFDSSSAQGGTVARAGTTGFTYTPKSGFTGTDSFTYTITDANGDKSTATVSVTVDNAAPVVDLNGSATGTGYSATFKENTAGVAIAGPAVSITDPDGTTVTGATIALTNAQAGDQLVVNTAGLPPGITVSASSTSSTIILTGTASTAAYQTALQQVLFKNTSDTPGATSRTINVTVNDGIANSNIAVTTIAIERGLITGTEPGIVYDSPAGTIRARANLCPRAASDGATRVDSVAFVNVPSFVLHGGLNVKLANRHIRADVAFGGAFYAIVDSEAAGLPIDAAHLPELRRAGMEIKHAIEAAHDIAHPLEPGLRGIYGTIFTGPASDDRADLRNVTIFADAEVDRSPCGTGTCAVMAVVDAMGLLDDRPGAVFRHESLIGTRFNGRVASRTVVGEHQAIVPEIEGSAWITGEHTFIVDESDPLSEGFRI
jgi:proline racemase